ncbi:MAG: M20/M25/M40 family metallo-hydrolase, partial [Anaerolineales bacterium]
AMAEEFIAGREFAVAILGNGTSLETLPIIEIDLGGDPNAIQTVDDKMKHPRAKICPANIPQAAADQLHKLAINAFNALGLFDFSRVDFRMDSQGQFFILEINSMASLNPTGSFVHAGQAAGLSYTDLVNRILDIAAIRYFGQSYRVENGIPVENETKRAEPLHIRVRSYLRSHLSTTLDHLEKMISISSHVHDIAGVNDLGNWISNRFQQLGFHRHIFPQTEVGNIFYFSNHPESEQNDILLLSHLDTIHDHQKFVPFRGERGLVYGSGVTESKGGIAVILAALKALRYARVLKLVRCGVLLTPDDNLHGRLSNNMLLRYASDSKYVLGVKYGDLNGGVVTSCSGTQQYQIDLKQTTRDKPRDIRDVVTSISRKAIAWEKLSSAQAGVKITIDSLKAERNHASVQLTASYFQRDQITELDQQIRKIAAKETSKNFLVRIRVIGSRSPVSDNTLNRSFFEKIQKLARLLELKIEPIHRSFSSDICCTPENVPVLGGLGPIGNGSGFPDEYILRDSLIDRSALLALIINNCGSE